MKTLNVIQTLSKIGKILSKIIYICCIVGGCGCLVGVAALLIGERSIKIDGVTLHSLLQTEAGVSVGTIWAAIIVGLILSAGEFAVSRMAYRYFCNELRVGTPFTLSGAKEMLHLGISTIWIPVVSAVLARVAYEITSAVAANIAPMDIDAYDSVALGVMFIVMSLLCRYGAEFAEKYEKADSEAENIQA